MNIKYNNVKTNKLKLSNLESGTIFICRNLDNFEEDDELFVAMLLEDIDGVQIIADLENNLFYNDIYNYEVMLILSAELVISKERD